MKVAPREVEKLLHENGMGEEDFFDPPAKFERKRKPQKRPPLLWPVEWFGGNLRTQD